MKNKLVRLAAKLTTAAMVVSMFANVAPASAAITVASDTMSRLNAGVTASHAISFVSDVAVTGNDARTLTIDFGANGDFNGEVAVSNTDVTVTINAVNIDVVTGACAAGDILWASTNDQSTLTFCTGTDVSIGHVVTIAIADGDITNPSGAGSYQINFGGTALIAGAVQVAIMDYDYVTVTATIQSTMSFDIDIASSCAAEVAGPYAISFGDLTAASVTTDGDHICLDLATNADGGAVVEVMNNTANGLDGQATVDSINTAYGGASVQLVAGTEGYGLCVDAVDSLAGTIQSVAPYNGNAGTCATHYVGGVDSVFRAIANTNGDPATGNADEAIDIVVKASIATTTMADNYQSILTFRATGTY